MPDLTIESMWMCSSLKYQEIRVQGSAPEPNIVTFSESLPAYCNCKASQYGRNCKHIAIAEKEMCKWHELTDSTPPVEKNGVHYCPLCGEEATGVMVAV